MKAGSENGAPASNPSASGRLQVYIKDPCDFCILLLHDIYTKADFLNKDIISLNA